MSRAALLDVAPAARKSPLMLRADTAQGARDLELFSSIRGRGALSLFAILLVTLLMRAPGFDRPLLGHFGTKSAVYGMIARNLAEGRAGFFEPTLDLLKGGQRSLHMLELPLPAYFVGGCWRLFGGSLDAWGRGFSIAWSIAGVALMYSFMRRRHGEVAAIGSSAALAMSPVGIIFGQSFQLESALPALSLGALVALDRYLEAGRLRWLAVATLCAAMLFLTKIFMVLLLVPLAWLVWERRPSPSRSLGLLAVGVFSVVPAALWYGYAYRAAQGDFAFPVERLYYSVHDSAAVHGFPHPLLSTGAFYLRLTKDLLGPVLTPVGCLLFAWGVCRGRDRLCVAWLAGVALLVLALPRKFHEMSYYWVGMLPVFCAFAGLGVAKLCAERSTRPGVRPILFAGSVLWLALSFKLAYVPAFVTPAEDISVMAAAEKVRLYSPPESRIVTVHGTSLSLLYHCDRPGWVWEIRPADPALNVPTIARQLDAYRNQGAEWLVIADGWLLASPVWQEGTSSLEHVSSGPGFAVYRMSPAPCCLPELAVKLGGRRWGLAPLALAGQVSRESTQCPSPEW